jgi:hypothetical protein
MREGGDQKLSLVALTCQAATPSNCLEISRLFLRTIIGYIGYRAAGETLPAHQGEARGYGNNLNVTQETMGSQVLRA